MLKNQFLSIYPIFQEINKEYKIILKFIDKCKDNNIKVIIFDWDQTISKVHMYHKLSKMWKNSLENCKSMIESLSKYLCYEKIDMEKKASILFFSFCII